MDTFRTQSSSTIAQSIRSSFKKLADLGTTVDRAEFDNLRIGLVSSLQEMNLRLVKMEETFKDLKTPVTESHYRIAECLRNLSEFDPDSDISHLISEIRAICDHTLQLSEVCARKQVQEAAKPALQTLDILDKSMDYKNMFLNIKIFGVKLLKFLEVSALQYHDLRCSCRKTVILNRVLSIKKVLPILIQSLRESLRSISTPLIREGKHFFFGFVRNCIDSIVTAFQEESIDNDESGLFVKSMDSIMDMERITSDNYKEFESNVEWVIKFGLSVVKASEDTDNVEMVNASAQALKELSNLKTALVDTDSNIDLSRDIIKDMMELVEQSINVCLLRLITKTFGNIREPLDKLITKVLDNSNIIPLSDRSHEDLNNEIRDLDNHSDLLLQVGHFARLCTFKSETIDSVSFLLAELERELVPSIVKFYLNPSSVEDGRYYLSALRRLWLSEVESLETSIMDIVDSTAFVVVANDEVRRMATNLKRHQYSQDADFLRSNVIKIIKICQMSVDLSWRDKSNNICDDHPIVKVERSSWEVSNALKAVMDNIDDLNKHRAFIRRIQLLATSMDIMANYLTSHDEDEDNNGNEEGSVRVLSSVSRIVINESSLSTSTAIRNHRHGGSDYKISSLTNNNNNNNNTVTSKNSGTNSEIIRQTLNKNSKLFESFRVQTRRTMKDEESFDRQNTLDLTEVIEKLSGSVLDRTQKKKDLSLRQTAIKNYVAESHQRFPLKSLNIKFNHSSSFKVNQDTRRLQDISDINKKLERIKASV